MTPRFAEESNNCFFGLVDLLRSDSTQILYQTIPNSGKFTWYIENLNYDNRDLNIILSNEQSLVCGDDTRIYQTHIISDTFRISSRYKF